MFYIIRFVFCIWFIASVSFIVQAQPNASLSPEIEQMHENAIQYAKRGNYKDALLIYKQMTTLQPTNSVLQKEVGEIYFLNKDYKEAVKKLKPLLKKLSQQERLTTFNSATSIPEIVAGSQLYLKKYHASFKTIKQGIANYPNANGGLYTIKGLVYEDKHKKLKALNTYIRGIKQDTGCYSNYYYAAKIYLHSRNVVPGLLLAEMYLNLDFDADMNTQKTDLKKEMFEKYKELYENLLVSKEPNYNKAQSKAITFEDKVTAILKKLTPVLSDGITTENLTMFRTRFLIEWLDTANYTPFPLFDYEHMLAANGYFDIYNQKLFGETEDTLQNKAWNQFHAGDIQRLDSFINANKMKTDVFIPFFNKRYYKKSFFKVKKMKGLSEV